MTTAKVSHFFEAKKSSGFMLYTSAFNLIDLEETETPLNVSTLTAEISYRNPSFHSCQQHVETFVEFTAFSAFWSSKMSSKFVVVNRENKREIPIGYRNFAIRGVFRASDW